MTWEYEYDAETDETIIYWNGEKQGVVDGEITSWIGGYPRGEAREVIRNAVDDPAVVDLLYGFEKIREDE